MNHGSASLHGPEVKQAAGMVTAQANCTIEQAIAMMWHRADEDRVSIEDIATEVLDHSISFTESN